MLSALRGVSLNQCSARTGDVGRVESNGRRCEDRRSLTFKQRVVGGDLVYTTRSSPDDRVVTSFLVNWPLLFVFLQKLIKEQNSIFVIVTR